MGARLLSWWQRVRKPLKIFFVIVGCILAIALLVVIALAYIFNVNVPGLRGKTLWDWMQLLIIPLVLAVIALLFNRATTRTEQKIAAERYEQDKQIASRHYHQDREVARRRYEQDQQIALDKQREDLLQAYLDRMAELLLEKQLGTSASEEVRNVARVRTISVLTQLDARRIGYVFTFLREAGLMSTTSKDNVVGLKGADLCAVNWSQVNLSGANLSETDLSKANLRGSDLRGANLSGANLRYANLSGADLLGADLSGANLRQANLSKINLSQAILGKANLSEADLSGAILVEADLSKAILWRANLWNANLRRAILVEADLSEANLSGANLSQTNSSEAQSLQGATMPDGSIHE